MALAIDKSHGLRIPFPVRVPGRSSLCKGSSAILREYLFTTAGRQAKKERPVKEKAF